MSVQIVTDNIKEVVAVLSLLAKVDGLYYVECRKASPRCEFRLLVNKEFTLEEEQVAMKWLAHNGVSITSKGIYLLDRAVLSFNLCAGERINLNMDLISKMEGECINLLQAIQTELETIGCW